MVENFINDVDERRVKKYLEARSKHDLEACFRGNHSYKINERMSYFSSITDIVVLIEHCLYPLYRNGDIEVKQETETVLKTFSKSAKILDIDQVLSYMSYQKEDLLVKRNLHFI